MTKTADISPTNQQLIDKYADYLICRSIYDALSESREQMESNYIKISGVVNPDGTIPKKFYEIQDINVVDDLIESYGETVEKSGFDTLMADAMQNYLSARNEMLQMLS